MQNPKPPAIDQDQPVPTKAGVSPVIPPELAPETPFPAENQRPADRPARLKRAISAKEEPSLPEDDA